MRCACHWCSVTHDSKGENLRLEGGGEMKDPKLLKSGWKEQQRTKKGQNYPNGGGGEGDVSPSSTLGFLPMTITPPKQSSKNGYALLYQVLQPFLYSFSLFLNNNIPLFTNQIYSFTIL